MLFNLLIFIVFFDFRNIFNILILHSYIKQKQYETDNMESQRGNGEDLHSSHFGFVT